MCYLVLINDGCFVNSPGFLRLVEVLVEMSVRERKAFLQFATGCSSLPPGGLANLHPRLTVVRKVSIRYSRLLTTDTVLSTQ